MNLNRELPIIRYCIAKHCIVVPCRHWDISVQVTERRKAKVTRIASGGKPFMDFWTTSECYLRNGADETVAKNSTWRLKKIKEKRISPGIFITSSQFGRQCLHVSSGTCAADKKVNLFLAFHFPLTLVLVELYCGPRITHGSVGVRQIPQLVCGRHNQIKLD